MRFVSSFSLLATLWVTGLLEKTPDDLVKDGVHQQVGDLSNSGVRTTCVFQTDRCSEVTRFGRPEPT